MIIIRRIIFGYLILKRAKVVIMQKKFCPLENPENVCQWRWKSDDSDEITDLQTTNHLTVNVHKCKCKDFKEILIRKNSLDDVLVLSSNNIWNSKRQTNPKCKRIIFVLYKIFSVFFLFHSKYLHNDLSEWLA